MAGFITAPPAEKLAALLNRALQDAPLTSRLRLLAAIHPSVAFDLVRTQPAAARRGNDAPALSSAQFTELTVANFDQRHPGCLSPQRRVSRHPDPEVR